MIPMSMVEPTSKFARGVTRQRKNGAWWFCSKLQLPNSLATRLLQGEFASLHWRCSNNKSISFTSWVEPELELLLKNLRWNWR